MSENKLEEEDRTVRYRGSDLILEEDTRLNIPGLRIKIVNLYYNTAERIPSASIQIGKKSDGFKYKFSAPVDISTIQRVLNQEQDRLAIAIDMLT